MLQPLRAGSLGHGNRRNAGNASSRTIGSQGPPALPFLRPDYDRRCNVPAVQYGPAAAAADAQSKSQWPSLAGSADAVTAAIVNRQPRMIVMDAMSRPSNAQASLPGERPQQCLDMMQDAAMNFCASTEAWCKAAHRNATGAHRARLLQGRKGSGADRARVQPSAAAAGRGGRD